jgi:hypothetical protein
MRFKHADTVQKLKSSFLNEKKSFQASADAKVADMQQKANAVRVVLIIFMDQDFKFNNN